MYYKLFLLDFLCTVCSGISLFHGPNLSPFVHRTQDRHCAGKSVKQSIYGFVLARDCNHGCWEASQIFLITTWWLGSIFHITVTVTASSQKGWVMCSFVVSFYKLLNEQSSCRWFETKWSSCCVTLMLWYTMMNQIWPVLAKLRPNIPLTDGIVWPINIVTWAPIQYKDVV